MPEIPLTRWHQAQEAEACYWKRVTGNGVELVRITEEKLQAAEWVQRTAGQILDFGGNGTWLEVGIGPLGIGCIHLFPKMEKRVLVGIDPLPRMELNQDSLRPIEALIRRCRGANYRQITGMGERIELPSNSADLAVCYNVLDHCYHPEGVLKEIKRILKAGGHLLLGCDVYSMIGLIKYKVQRQVASRLGAPLKGIGYLAHPHHFLAAHLEHLVKRQEFEIISTNIRPMEFLRRLASHHHRLLIVAQKRVN